MAKITGNTKGIKNIILAELETVYEMLVPSTQIITEEMAKLLIKLTEVCEREIVVYINRRGMVVDVFLGNTSTATLNKVDSRRAEHKLSGVRCIHTHPGADSSLSDLDLSSLRRMRYDCMVALAGNAEEIQASMGCIIGCDAQGNFEIGVHEQMPLAELLNINCLKLVERIDKQLNSAGRGYEVDKEQEQAIIVGLELPSNRSSWKIENSLDELKQLADTAGANVVGRVWQKRDRPDAALYIGRGKLDEIRMLCQQTDADLVVFDDELSPAQQRNIEALLGIKVLDRTALILDIFAQRARTHEGKLQVALAQMQYNLPRIMGQGLVLSRLGGGIGTRGPGETKLETDRRYIRDRINDIKKELEQVKKVRQLHRKQRENAGVTQVSLVGYTNAGKSTLLNELTATQSQVYVANQLFATLDPTTRVFKMDNQQEVSLTDTVGFVQKLPHQLVAAFRATLEEVVWADLLLHVVDVSHELYKEQIEAVNTVLKELNALDKKIIMVYNKIDLVQDAELLSALAAQDNAVLVSAKSGTGFGELSSLIAKNLNMLHKQVTLLIPYEQTALVNKVHELAAAIVDTQYLDNGTQIVAKLPNELIPQFESYIKE